MCFLLHSHTVHKGEQKSSTLFHTHTEQRAKQTDEEEVNIAQHNAKEWTTAYMPVHIGILIKINQCLITWIL